jgi:hypothetical protein
MDSITSAIAVFDALAQLRNLFHVLVSPLTLITKVWRKHIRKSPALHRDHDLHPSARTKQTSQIGLTGDCNNLHCFSAERLS